MLIPCIGKEKISIKKKVRRIPTKKNDTPKTVESSIKLYEIKLSRDAPAAIKTEENIARE
jgi:hypothetical protein